MYGSDDYFLPQGEQLPFVHADSDETNQYVFDTAFLQSAEFLDTYVSVYNNVFDYHAILSCEQVSDLHGPCIKS